MVEIFCGIVIPLFCFWLFWNLLSSS